MPSRLTGINQLSSKPTGTTREISKSRIERECQESRLDFGHRVREAREARRLSQRALGTLVRKNQGYISRIEHGQYNLRLDTIATLADALGMKIAIRLADPKRD